MANIFKRKSGSYCIRVSNGKPGGKQKFIAVTYKPPAGLTEKEAEKAARSYAVMFEAAVREGIYTPGMALAKISTELLGITLERFVNEYYYDRIELRLSPNTVQFYKNVVEQCLLPSFGKTRLCDISSAHLQAFIDFLASPGSRTDENNKSALSPATVKRYATVFSSVMTEAFKMNLVEKDVLHRQYVSYPKVYKKPLQAYDDEEAQKFFEGLAEEPIEYRAMLVTSLLLGLRRGEVVGLMWSDFDFKKGCVNINRSAYKVTGVPQAVKDPKSVSSIRTIFFSKEYETILLEWKEEQYRQRLSAGIHWQEQGYVFTNKKGNMLGIHALTRICSRFEKKHDLRHLKLHGLRHTCGSLMIRNGVDIETVKSVFGHESIRTTQQYLSAYDGAKREAANKLSDIIIVGKGDDE